MKYSNFLSKVSQKAIAAGLPILAALVLSLAVLPGGARADILTTYTVNGMFQSGGSLSGSFTIDYNGQNPVVYSANFLADGNSLVCTAASSCPVFATADSSSNTIHGIDIPMGSYPFLFLGWSPIDYSNPPNALTISLASYCAQCSAGINIDQLISATAIDPANGENENNLDITQTPEPPAALLFGMGLIGIGTLVARRKNASVLS